MKFNTEETTIITTGSDDFVEMEYGIRNADVGFVIQLLRQDLYSRPIDACVREIASNSRDANIENEVLSPIEITISKNPYLENQTSISFIDEGIGISPKRMKETYLNYGASTKRDDDNQTGMWGLGCKSPHAYSQIFCIETISCGKKYVYLSIVQDGNKGKMIKLSETDTNEHSGTKVTIPIKPDDVCDFEQAAIASTFFWSPRPIYKNFTSFREVNEYRKVFENERFMIVSEEKRNRSINFVRNSRVAVLLDGIPYEIDNTVKNVEDINYLLRYNNENTLVFIKAKVGEVTISPNRETLQYNEKTVKVLLEGIKDITDVIEKDCVELLKRTTNDIDKHLVAKEINKSNHSVDFTIRPFNKYSKEEWSKLLFSVKYIKQVSEKDLIKDWDGKYFIQHFPQLELAKIEFETSDRVASGVKNLYRGGRDFDSNFFKHNIYFLDIPNRKKSKERFYAKNNEYMGMFLIVPNAILHNYKNLSKEDKKLHIKEYREVRKSIKLLAEHKIEYIPYSSLGDDKIKYQKKGSLVKTEIPVKMEYGRGTYRIVKWNADDFEVSEKRKYRSSTTNDTYKKDECVYVVVDSLRDIPSCDNYKMRLFKTYCNIECKEIRIFYVNKKDEDRVKPHLKTLDEYVRGISEKSKKKIGNAIIFKQERFEFDLNSYKGIEFSTKRFQDAVEIYNKEVKENSGNRIMLSSDEYKPFTDLSPLKEVITVLREMQTTFEFLQQGTYGISKKHIQKYVTLIEKDIKDNP